MDDVSTVDNLTEIDQGAYADDFLSSGNGSQSTEGQAQPDATNAETTDGQPEVTEAQATSELKGLDNFFFEKDQGGKYNFRADKMAFDAQRQQQQQEQAKPVGKIGAPIQPEAQQEQAKSAIRQRLEERRTYEGNLRSNLLYAANQSRNRLIQAGLPTDAIDQSIAEVEAQIRNHMEEWDIDRAEKEESDRSKAEQERAEAAKAEPLALANMTKLYEKVGGRENFDQLMFSEQYGGSLVWEMFENANPDKAKLAGQALTDAMQTWWHKFASNPQRLGRLYDTALSVYFAQNHKRYADGVKQREAAAATQQRQRVARPLSGAPTRQQRAVETPGTVNKVDSWLSAAPGQSMTYT